MGAAIGDVLPLALGIAISPVPIIAAILMLLSPKARVTSVGFLLGWLVGVIVATVVFTLLSSILPTDDSDAAKPVQGTIKLVLGVLLLLLAGKQWQGRPQGDAEPVLPKWMQAIDKITFPAAAGLGFLLSALNPKNLIMAAGAGVAIGSASLATGSSIVVLVIFTLIAVSTVAIPVLAYLFAASKLRDPLNRLRGWLEKENAVIMAVLLLVIGIAMIGKGIGSF